MDINDGIKSPILSLAFIYKFIIQHPLPSISLPVGNSKNSCFHSYGNLQVTARNCRDRYFLIADVNAQYVCVCNMRI